MSKYALNNYKNMSQEELEVAIKDWFLTLEEDKMLRKMWTRTGEGKQPFGTVKGLFILFLPIIPFLLVALSSVWLDWSGVLPLFLCVAPPVSLFCSLVTAIVYWNAGAVVNAREAYDKFMLKENM